MNNLFDLDEKDAKFIISKEKEIIRKQIADVINDVNCDIIGIQEGPSNVKKMELFVKEYLDDKFICFGGFDGAQQCTYLLARKGSKSIENPCIFEKAQRWLFQSWSFDIKGDLVLGSYAYTRTPIVLKANIEVDGVKKDLFVINIHTKSKHVNKGKEKWMSKDDDSRVECIKKSIEARRRIASECFRTRKCIDDIILADFPDAYIIVLGDLNDGPGMDFFEEYYLLFDSSAALLGSPFHYKQLLYAILFEELSLEEAYSVEFHDYIDEIEKKRVLLDHIFVNMNMKSLISSLGVAHKVYESHVLTKEKTVISPSDHRPVYCDFKVSPKVQNQIPVQPFESQSEDSTSSTK